MTTLRLFPRLEDARRERAVVVGVVGALALCVPAWHVVTALLSDSYMTLYTGRWIASHGVPHHEVFTLAATSRPWVDQQWLAELLTYEVWRAGGYGLVGLFNGCLIAGAYGALAAVLLRRGAGVIGTIACCSLALLIGLPSMFVRAQNFALVLFVLLLAACLADEQRDSPRWWLGLVVPLLVLWANLHGSVLLGAGLVCAYLVYRAARAARRNRASGFLVYAGLTCAGALAPLATPYGLGIVGYYRDVIGNSAIAAAAPDYRAPSLSSPTTALSLFLIGLIALGLAHSALKRRRASATLVVATLATALAGVVASRNVVWFAILAATLLASLAPAASAVRQASPRFLAGLGCFAAALTTISVVLYLLPGGASYERLTPLRAITAAAAYARTHPAARVLADNAASSALLWHEPQLAGKVAYDARLERYPPQSLRRWIDFQRAAGDWRAMTVGYAVLIGSTSYNPRLVRRLTTNSARILARDGTGVATVQQPEEGR